MAKDYYHIGDRQKGGSAGTVEGVNDYWRFMVVKNDNVIALVRSEKTAQEIIDKLKGD